MHISKISLASNAPKFPAQDPIFNKAMEEILGHSDKDFLALTKKSTPLSETNKIGVIERAKKFFSAAFGQ